MYNKYLFFYEKYQKEQQAGTDYLKGIDNGETLTHSNKNVIGFSFSQRKINKNNYSILMELKESMPSVFDVYPLSVNEKNFWIFELLNTEDYKIKQDKNMMESPEKGYYKRYDIKNNERIVFSILYDGKQFSVHLPYISERVR